MAGSGSTRMIAVMAVAVAAVLVYLPGVGGPFILDDHVNLLPVWNWWAGQLGAWDAATQNASGPTGRPLAYLTLMANALAGRQSPLGFKLFNLFLHVGAIALAARVTTVVSRRDRTAWPAWLALAATAAWALHPQLVSTVLYVIQRMAILGALAQLGAVALYLHARPLLDTDAPRARRLLFLALPAVVVAGLLAKETAVCAVLLCAAAELTLFSGARRHREVRAFFAVFLALPLALGVAYSLWHPQWLADRFDGREFTLAQRLLTQPRVLADYFLGFAWPRHWGIYRDGYEVSQGLLAPASTWMAMAGGLLAAGAAVLWRRRRPALAFGLLWFAAAHALEAGPFSLEMFFEHRNYLPALGLAIALAAAVAPLAARRRRAGMVVASVIVAVLASLTVSRVLAWRNTDALLAAESPPAGEISRRLQVDRAIRAFELGDIPRREAALAVLDGDGRSASAAGNAAAAAQWRLIFACEAGEPIAAAQREALALHPPGVVTHNHVSWMDVLARRVVAGKCDGLAPPQLAQAIDAWLHSGAHVPAHARVQLASMQDSLRGGSAPPR